MIADPFPTTRPKYRMPWPGDTRPLYVRALEQREQDARDKIREHRARLAAWRAHYHPNKLVRVCAVCGKRGANFGDKRPLCRAHWLESRKEMG